MTKPRFSKSLHLSYQSFDVEIVQGFEQERSQLETIRNEVLYIAALSTDWEDAEALEAMRRHFKIGPMYAADLLVLIRQNGALVALMGGVTRWPARSRSLVHLCSLGLLPETQNAGFMQVFLALFWAAAWHDARWRSDCRAGRAYVSTISQSPHVLGLLARSFDTYPTWMQEQPDPAQLSVARHVHARFAPEVDFNEHTFVLRNERDSYPRFPYSLDRPVNSSCMERLQVDEGDVFLIVGRALASDIARYIRVVDHKYSELFALLLQGLCLPSPESTCAAWAALAEDRHSAYRQSPDAAAAMAAELADSECSVHRQQWQMRPLEIYLLLESVERGSESADGGFASIYSDFH